MIYREHPPHPGLAPFVRCYWMLASEGGGPTDRVLPDGRSEIVLHLARPFRRHREGGASEVQAASFLIGEIDRPFLLQPTGPVDVFGVRLQAGGAAALAGAPAPGWTGRTIDLGSLWGRDARELPAALAGAATFRERVARAERLLFRRIGDRAAEPRVAAAFGRLVRGEGIDSAAAAAAVGARQLERLFRHHVGLSPKRVQRLLRFRRALHLLRAGRPPADAARRCGYADQAHLTREFREFSGTTPGAFAAEPAPLGDLFVESGAA